MFKRSNDTLAVVPDLIGDPGLHVFPLKPALDLIGGGNDRQWVSVSVGMLDRV